MTDRSVWLITFGETEAVAQLTASQLHTYGLSIKGQKWPLGESQAWLVSAQEAAAAEAGLIILIISSEQYQQPLLRRQLSLFRLSLQTLIRRNIDGLIILTDPTNISAINCDLPGTGLLSDFEIVKSAGWQAKAVARFHAPRKSKWPVRFGLFAQEKLGLWLEVKPQPTETTSGCMVGVSGQDADIIFHAVGASGQLPERSINEFEMKGIEFETAGHTFKAWALQNTFYSKDSYYVRISGEPDLLAIGTLNAGQISDVDLFCLR